MSDFLIILTPIVSVVVSILATTVELPASLLAAIVAALLGAGATFLAWIINTFSRVSRTLEVLEWRVGESERDIERHYQMYRGSFKSHDYPSPPTHRQ